MLRLSFVWFGQTATPIPTKSPPSSMLFTCANKIRPRNENWDENSLEDFERKKCNLIHMASFLKTEDKLPL